MLSKYIKRSSTFSPYNSILLRDLIILFMENIYIILILCNYWRRNNEKGHQRK